MLIVSEQKEQSRLVDKEKIALAVRMILEAIGEEPDREGLLDTPRRVADYYEEVTAGLHRDPYLHLETIFHEEYEEIVLMRDIPFHSVCEHHLVPFMGKVHVAYLPQNGRVVGLSKLARVVEDFARRPQLQERLTNQVAEAVMHKLNAKGVMIVCEAEHMCMSMRGVKKAGSTTVTTAVRGIYETDHVMRAEVISLIRGFSR